MATQKPTYAARRGKLELAIWTNESENGSFYRATFSRAYRGADGKLKNTTSFSQKDLSDLLLLVIDAQGWLLDAERAQQAPEELSTPDDACDADAE